MSTPPHGYLPSSRLKHNLGPSNEIVQGDNIVLSSTTATLVLPAGTVTWEVRLFLQAMGTNTTEVAIGPAAVATAKGADVLKTVNDYWIQAVNHSEQPIYVKADHADGATIRVSYSRAY